MTTLPSFANTRFDLAGRVALVTGAGVGIGQASAIAMAGAGADVAVHFHQSAAGAEETAAVITKAGGRAFLLQADLTQEAEAVRLVDRVVEQGGGLDILFNNAGNPLIRSSLEECPTELWMQAFQVNVHAAF